MFASDTAFFLSERSVKHIDCYVTFARLLFLFQVKSRTEGINTVNHYK